MQNDSNSHKFHLIQQQQPQMENVVNFGLHNKNKLK